MEDFCCDDSLTAQRWLKAKMPLLSEDGIKSILAEWGIEPSLSPSDLSEREKDLILAQGYFEMVMLCSSVPSVKDADGNWSHEKGALNVSPDDKQRWKNLYAKLRRKWGMEVLLPASIRLDARGFRLWRRL